MRRGDNFPRWPYTTAGKRFPLVYLSCAPAHALGKLICYSSTGTALTLAQGLFSRLLLNLTVTPKRRVMS